MPEHADRQPAPVSRPSLSDSSLDKADPARVLRILLRPRSRWLVCWIIALVSAGMLVWQGWNCFNEPERGDGNWGHASIDFGGQWTMGRMIVEGHGRQLYNRNYLRGVLEDGYPVADQKPQAKDSDAENLIGWMMGRDNPKAPAVWASFLTPLSARDVCGELTLLAAGRDVWTQEQIEQVTAPQVGGALYPPIHAVLFAPLGALPPRIAYRVMQTLTLILVFFCGWVAQRLTEGRIWWPITSVLIILFPGFVGCLNLGQNAMISLTVLLVGWWQLSRGRPVLAGVCWGFLAFKPVWAASFFLVPLLTRRWRMAASMAVTGIVQIAATLPLVGWQSWLDWLQVGGLASETYKEQKNWIMLSRDLLGIPRRWLLTFDGGIAVNPDHLLASVLGWSLWTTVLIVTLLVVWRRWRKMSALTGPCIAFVMIGAFFSCYHFMYYDFLIAALPVCLLFTEPRRYLQAIIPPWLARLTSKVAKQWDAGLSQDDLTSPPLIPSARRLHWLHAAMPLLLLLLIMLLPAISDLYGYLYDPSQYLSPAETFGLLLLWAWCGYRVWVDPPETTEMECVSAASWPLVALDGAVGAAQLSELGADIGRAHKGLADQHGADAGRL